MLKLSNEANTRYMGKRHSTSKVNKETRFFLGKDVLSRTR